MKIAVASGKGGTGKTTVAVNLTLSVAAPARGEPSESVQLLDCDVEAPNCHIFMKPKVVSTKTVTVPIPEVDGEKCDACGECSRLCQYNAIVCLKSKPIVFAGMCHGCGGCTLICPQQAISEVGWEIGVIDQGTVGAHCDFAQGRLKIGEIMSPPLIRAVKRTAKQDHLVIIDAPPGTSCPVVETVKGCDYVILVTEPTPFGLNDLWLAVEMTEAMSVPFGVVINRSDTGDNRVHEFCREQNIPILAQIPNDRRIAEAYSRGEVIIDALPEYRSQFDTIMSQIRRQEVGRRDAQ